MRHPCPSTMPRLRQTPPMREDSMNHGSRPSALLNALGGWAIALAVALSGCPAPEQNGPTPVSVETFAADATRVAAGSPVTLSWKVAGDLTQVELRRGADVLRETSDAEGSYRVDDLPAGTTTFTLVAWGLGGDSQRAELDVEAVTAAAVERFEADRLNAPAGSAVTLSWRTVLADRVQVTAGDALVHEATGAQARDGRVVVRPTQDTTYRLEAVGLAGSDARTLDVTVTLAPAFTLAEAQPERVTRGETVTVRWQTERATSLVVKDGARTLLQAGEEQIADGSLDLTVDQSRTITLVAAGPGGTETVTLPIEVVPPARIDTLLATPIEVVAGSSTRLSWTLADADEVALYANGEPVELTEPGVPAGAFTHTPADTTVYELVASGEGGEARREILVRVHGAPVIEHFDARPHQAFRRRDPVVLEWKTSGAIAVTVSTSTGEIVDLGDAAAALGSAESYPDEDTTYVLTAIGPGGSVTSAPVSVTVGEPPPLIELALLRPTVNRGMSSELSWRIAEADSFEVAESVDGELFRPVDISGKGLDDALTITPAVNTTYRVRATNQYGTTEKTVLQRVVNPPAFERFALASGAVPHEEAPDTYYVTMDEQVSIEWVATDADGVLFDPASGFIADAPEFRSILDREGTLDVQVPSGTTGVAQLEFPDNFSFPFFGVAYGTVRMTVPGYLCFGDNCGSSASSSNQNIPSTSTPNGVIAVFWDSLKSVTGQTRWAYRIDGVPPSRRVTLEWNGMDINSSTNDGEHLSFQAVLHEDGRWEIWNAPREIGSKAPGNNDRWGNSATIGVESPDGNSALVIGYNNARALCSTYKAGSGSGASGTPGECTPITRYRPALLPAAGSLDMTFTPPNFANNVREVYARAFGPLGAVQSTTLSLHVNRKPTLSRFTVDRTHVGLGESVKFEWAGNMNPSMDFARVELRRGDGSLVTLPDPTGMTSTAFSGTVTLTPSATDTYTLVALNKAGWETKSETARVVVGPPTLEGVTVSPGLGAMNDPYTISWTKSEGVSSVRLVAPDGSTVFTLPKENAGVQARRISTTDLTQPGEYQLIASNSSGDSEPGRFTLDIATDTRIVSFVTDVEEQTAGRDVKFGWETYNATSLRLLANGAEVLTRSNRADIRRTRLDAAEPVTVKMPAVDTDFVLEITGPGGTATETVHVRAAPTPRVTELLTEPSTVQWGQPFQLKWKSQNASKLRVQHVQVASGPRGEDNLPREQVVVLQDFPVTPAEYAEGQVTMTLRQKGTLRVVAENDLGDKAEQRIERDPLRTAPSLEFQVQPAEGSPRGGYFDLSWSASQVDGVLLWKRLNDAESLQVPYEYVPHRFVDISATGEELTLLTRTGTADYRRGYATVAFPDAFRPAFFGTKMASMTVSARGILTLSDEPDNPVKNGCVYPKENTSDPTASECASISPGKADEPRPNAYLAPFQGSLGACGTQTSGATCASRVGGAPDAPGQVFWQIVGQAPNRVLVVQWNNWDFDSSTYKATLTFQAKLHENGDSEFQYKRLFSQDVKRGAGDMGILAVESPDGQQFVQLDQYTSNDPVVFDGDGYRFYTGVQPLERPASNPLRSRFLVGTGLNQTVTFRATALVNDPSPPTRVVTQPVLPGQFVITEMLVDSGTADDTGLEWIEITNFGPRANLKGYSLTSSSSFTSPFTFTEDLFVDQNKSVVVAQSASPALIGSAQVAAVYGSGLKLHNVSDAVAITWGDVLIDRVEYDKTAGWTVPRGQSLMLDPRAREQHNDVPHLWCSGYTLQGGKASPGEENAPCYTWELGQNEYDPTTDIAARTGADPAYRVLTTSVSASWANSLHDYPIGFAFPYFGQRHMSLSVSHYGFATLGQMGTSLLSTPSTTWRSAVSLGNDPNRGIDRIAPFWANLSKQTTNSAPASDPAAIYAMVDGEAPNRRFIVQWAHYRQNGDANKHNFSMVLGEQGEIEFHYKEIVTDKVALSSSYNVAIGVEAFYNTLPIQAFGGHATTTSAPTELTQIPSSGSRLRLVRRP